MSTEDPSAATEAEREAERRILDVGRKLEERWQRLERRVEALEQRGKVPKG